MAKGASSPRNVEFAKEVISCRQPRDDEVSVMEWFARHANKCPYCHDPYEAYRRDRPLCKTGTDLAKDVVKYLYAKGGKPFSVVDRLNGERVQVAVPAGCEVVSLLIKAVGKGFSLESKPVIEHTERREKVERIERIPVSPSSPSRRYVDEPLLIPASSLRPDRRQPRDDYDTVVIKPHNSQREGKRDRVIYRDRIEDRSPRYTKERPKTVIYPEGKGSLFVRDEEDKKRRKQYERQPVVILAEPGQRYTIRR